MRRSAHIIELRNCHFVLAIFSHNVGNREEISGVIQLYQATHEMRGDLGYNERAFQKIEEVSSDSRIRAASRYQKPDCVLTAH
jgi:hypothetical protein